MLNSLKNLVGTLDKLNYETDNHLFRDYEVVPKTLQDPDLPPPQLRIYRIDFLVDMISFSRNSEF